MNRIPRRTSHSGSAIAALAATTLALAACGEASDPGSDGDGPAEVQLSFQWWGNDDRATATQQVVELYQDKNPDVSIETSFAPDANYWEKMATQVAGGNAPDVFQMKLEFLKEYAGRGVIMDLGEFVDSGVIDTSQMQDQYLAAGQVEGVTFGLPTGRSTQAFIYDPVAWAEYGLPEPTLGWTWDDLIEAGRVVAERSGGSQAIMSDPGNEQAWFETWLLQRGKSVYDDSGELNFDEQDLVEFWTFTTSLAEEGIFTPAHVTTANDWTMANSPLVKSQALAEVNHVSLAPAYFESFGEVVLAPIPADEGAESTGSYAGATQLLVIAADSEHPEVAADFIDFVLNDQEAGEILGLVRGMPINEGVLGALSTGFGGGDAAVYEFEQDMAGQLVAKPPVAPEGGSQSLLDFKNTYDRIIFDQLSVEDGASEMFAKFNSNIS